MGKPWNAEEAHGTIIRISGVTTVARRMRTAKIGMRDATRPVLIVLSSLVRRGRMMRAEATAKPTIADTIITAAAAHATIGVERDDFVMAKQNAMSDHALTASSVTRGSGCTVRRRRRHRPGFSRSMAVS